MLRLEQAPSTCGTLPASTMAQWAVEVGTVKEKKLVRKSKERRKVN